jgi:hypothetical protein
LIGLGGVDGRGAAAFARRGVVAAAGVRGVERFPAAAGGLARLAAFFLVAGCTFLFVFFAAGAGRLVAVRPEARELAARLFAPPAGFVFFCVRPVEAVFFAVALRRAGGAALRFAMNKSFQTLTVWR